MLLALKGCFPRKYLAVDVCICILLTVINPYKRVSKCSGVPTYDLLVTCPACYRLTRRLSSTAYKYIIITAVLVNYLSQCAGRHIYSAPQWQCVSVH
jgi:hypothetical protein